VFSASRFNFLSLSPFEPINAAYYLFMSGEIWGDIRLSLLEVVGGMVLGSSIALVVFALLSTTLTFRNFLFLLLPLTHIAPIVLWLLVWVTWIVGLQDFLVLWHKVIAVGCLTFFPFVQADRFHGTDPPNFNEGTHLISGKGPTPFQVVPFVF